MKTIVNHYRSLAVSLLGIALGLVGRVDLIPVCIIGAPLLFCLEWMLLNMEGEQ